MPYVSARIVDEASGQCAATGELQLRGRNVFRSYWRNADATARSFTHDGWFRTGDIVGTRARARARALARVVR
jgi:long-subunit acyl-CoA synthetase (AMP-forming)